MVKNKRGRTRRLVLSLIVVVAIGAVVGIAISTHSSAPGPSMHATLPPPMSTTTPNSTTSGTGTQPSGTTAPAPTVTTGVGHEPQPLGVGGRWKLIFSDGFNGHSLNQQKWNAHNGWTNQNGVSDSIDNVQVRNGDAILTLASPSSGAELGTRTFALRVGEFAQARIKFAGNGRTIYNWPAWWLSGPDWPLGGESDIAEGFGALTANYHSPSATIHSGPVAGDWANHFHTFGIYRARYFARIYWDGKVIGAYNTHDDGAPETLLLTLGASNQIKTGAAGAMVVDYVRAWVPAAPPGS